MKKVFYLLSMALYICACSSNEETEKPVPPPTPKPKPEVQIDYLKFNMNKTNQLTISQTTANEYTINTTGGDPYVSTTAFEKDLAPDSVVFTFQYRANQAINDLQLFFATPLTEARSLHAGSLSAAAEWATYSVTLKNERTKFNWGKTGNYLRVDFGTNAGITIHIRNLYFRSMNETEKAVEQEKENRVKRLLRIQDNLKKYLSTQYTSAISSVKVDANQITITGSYSGEGKFALCEVTPYEDLTETARFANRTALTAKSFNLSFNRHVERDGFNYDRLLSKWVIVREESSTKDIIASHAHYADDIKATRTLPAGILKSKKGLGGYHQNQAKSDLNDLNIHSVTINIPFTAFTYSTNAGNRIAHTYGGKTYYFDANVVHDLDASMNDCNQRDIIVSAIILIQPTASDPQLTNIFKHPDNNGGNFTMPNMTTAESTNLYAAVLDFMMSRYTREDQIYGRIHHIIVHNEVDYAKDWTNMGNDVPMLTYLDSYIKSMRMCYNIARSYDANAQVMASFTHSWTDENQPDYSSKKMLDRIIEFSNCEGDFQWGLAYHSYPQDLTVPDTWNDQRATYTMSTPFITFKNLEVIDKWIQQKSSMYKGTTKRMLWLSENGTNSPSYSENDLTRQAAGAAWAFKKISKLKGIDAIQWHNWIDNRAEYGLRIGLRRFPDDTTEPLGRKPVWHVYQAWETANENTMFAPYLTTIGISSWDEIFKTVP